MSIPWPCTEHRPMREHRKMMGKKRTLSLLSLNFIFLSQFIMSGTWSCCNTYLQLLTLLIKFLPLFFYVFAKSLNCWLLKISCQLKMASAVDFWWRAPSNRKECLFLLEGASSMSNTSTKYVRRGWFFFWLRDIFISNLARKTCLQTKFYQKRGKKIRQR